MRSQYSSFTSVEDRFNYKRKGVFRCRYKREAMYTAIYIAVVVIVLIVVLSAGTQADSNMASVIFTLAFDTLKVTSFVWFPLALIGGTRVILSGAEYSFTADEEKMLIVCPKENIRADIYYNNVLNVEYQERLTFVRKKLKGYLVTIYCKDGIKTFDFVFPYSSGTVALTKDLTPFRIIEERAGFLEKPEFIAGKRVDNVGV